MMIPIPLGFCFLFFLRRYEVPSNDLPQQANDTAKGKDNERQNAPPIAATESQEIENHEVEVGYIEAAGNNKNDINTVAKNLII